MSLLVRNVQINSLAAKHVEQVTNVPSACQHTLSTLIRVAHFVVSSVGDCMRIAYIARRRQMPLVMSARTVILHSSVIVYEFEISYYIYSAKVLNQNCFILIIRFVFLDKFWIFFQK